MGRRGDGEERGWGGEGRGEEERGWGGEGRVGEGMGRGGEGRRGDGVDMIEVYTYSTYSLCRHDLKTSITFHSLWELPTPKRLHKHVT